MLPAKLVAEFWTEVERLLGEEHRIASSQAREGIADYRALLASHGAGDVVYNAGEEEAAAAIAAALECGGFAEPDGLESAQK